MKQIVILLFVVIVFVAPIFLCNEEKYILDENVRESIPGDFVKLSDGITHYEYNKQGNGNVIVLVHGFSIPYMVWDYIYPELEMQGFSILRYDIFGRGFSDRPIAEYNPEFFNKQLVELLNFLKINRKIDIVGISMGGAISLNFSAKYPDKVRKIALISPYGIPQDFPLTANLLLIPYIGEYIMAAFGDWAVMRRFSNNFYRLINYHTIEEKFIKQKQYKGYKRSLLSTSRNFINVDFIEIYKKVAEKKMPVLLLWGTEDIIIPFESSSKFQKVIPQVEFYPLKGLGHTPVLERPHEVNELLIKFIKD